MLVYVSGFQPFFWFVNLTLLQWGAVICIANLSFQALGLLFLVTTHKTLRSCLRIPGLPRHAGNDWSEINRKVVQKNRREGKNRAGG